MKGKKSEKRSSYFIKTLRPEIFVLFIISIIMLGLISGCSSNSDNFHSEDNTILNEDTSDNSEKPEIMMNNESDNNILYGPGKDGVELENIVIKKDGQLTPDECVKRYLAGQYIMLESKYCGHCLTALPKFQEACDELGIKPIIIDISTKEGQEQSESFGIQAVYTPTFLLDCSYYVGSMSTEKFIELMKEV